jgi:hypothetical protein
MHLILLEMTQFDVLFSNIIVNIKITVSALTLLYLVFHGFVH